MANVLTAPIRLAVGLPMAASLAVNNLFFSKDIKSGERPSDESLIKLEERSLFDLASPNLDLCFIIYYYTELRSATKLKLKAFAENKKLSYKFGKNPSDIEILYNALREVKKTRDNLEIALSPSVAVADYKASLKGIENLKKRFNLTSGDIKVLEEYFEILSSEPKQNTTLKKDLRLYSSYIDPQFRLFFGGKDFNVETVEALVDLDETSYIYKIDDDFVTTSLDLSEVMNNFGAELVYAIAISDKFKTISVVFRGSINIQDWLQNLDLNSTECLFPGFTTERGMDTVEQTSFGKVHAGFYEYLFGKTEQGRNGSCKSKGEEIMGILTSLVQGEKKGYRVVFTGHSLGGALSTLMAARCAAFNELKSTVINVSIASPFVGDQEFRNSFYKMEQTKQIMHLRVSNYEDIVPLVPSSTFPVPDFHTYKQTGWNVKLFDKTLIHPFFSLSYPKKGDLVNAISNAVNTNLFVGFNINLLNHLPTEYRRRLDAAKGELDQYTLADLYNTSESTGWKFDDVAEEPEVAGEQD